MEEDVFGAARNGCDAPALELRLQAGRNRIAQIAAVELEGQESFAQETRRQSARDGFDLGQFGHGSRRLASLGSEAGGAYGAPMARPDTSETDFGFRRVGTEEHTRLVRGVFDRVARRYDLMNDLMSAGVHRLWKDAVAARLNPQPGELIIDCAGGTGDLAGRFARMARAAQLRRGGEDARVLVIDYNAEMIAAGR